MAYVILAVTWIATQLSLLLSCQPFHAFWQITPNPGSEYYHDPLHESCLTAILDFCQPTISRVYVLLTVILNIVTDMYLLSIPLPLLWTVNIGMKRKVPLMALFSGATFVMIAGIIRAATIMSVRHTSQHTLRVTNLTHTTEQPRRCRSRIQVGLP